MYTVLTVKCNFVGITTSFYVEGKILVDGILFNSFLVGKWDFM